MGTFILHVFYFLFFFMKPLWPREVSLLAPGHQPLSGNMAIETAGLTPKPFVVTTVVNSTFEKGTLGEAQLENLGIWKLTLL